MRTFSRSPGLLCTIIPEVDVSFAIWPSALWPSSPVDTRRSTILTDRKDVTSRNGYRCKRVIATKVPESDDDTSRWTVVDRPSSRQRHLSATVAVGRDVQNDELVRLSRDAQLFYEHYYYYYYYSWARSVCLYPTLVFKRKMNRIEVQYDSNYSGCDFFWTLVHKLNVGTITLRLMIIILFFILLLLSTVYFIIHEILILIHSYITLVITYSL